MATRSPHRAARAAAVTLAVATLLGPLAAGPASADDSSEDLRTVPTYAAATLIGPKAGGRASAANSSEKELRTYINEARDKRGARELGMRSFLVRAARRHSRQMASTGQLVHSTDLASYAGNRDWRILGENIGYGPSMEVLHEAFMDSPPHRRNELNRRYKKVGVGMAEGDDGRIWVTVLFFG